MKLLEQNIFKMLLLTNCGFGVMTVWFGAMSTNDGYLRSQNLHTNEIRIFLCVIISGQRTLKQNLWKGESSRVLRCSEKLHSKFLTRRISKGIWH